VAFVFAMSRPVFAVTTAPTLGTASTFAVLGATTVTNTGLSVITGDLGVSPGTACTGLPTPCTGNGPGVVTGGTVHAGDAVAAQAHTDLATAYAALKAMQCGTNLTGKVLGVDVTTLAAGVYCFDSSAQLTGTLHVSGTVVFQMGSTLTTASNSFVIVDDNSGCGGNVYWQIGSSATIGTGTTFAGNIVALTSITITTSAIISGRALAVNAAVTMDTNHISACGAGLPTGGPCDTGTGDSDHHHNDKGETGDNDHHHDDNGKHLAKGHDSLSDRAQSFMMALAMHNPQHSATHSTATNHDTDDSHGHHSHDNDKGHNDKDDCAKNNDNENHNSHDTDDQNDNEQSNDD
jgi:hypothetical protein